MFNDPWSVPVHYSVPCGAALLIGVVVELYIRCDDIVFIGVVFQSSFLFCLHRFLFFLFHVRGSCVIYSCALSSHPSFVLLFFITLFLFVFFNHPASTHIYSPSFHVLFCFCCVCL